MLPLDGRLGRLHAPLPRHRAGQRLTAAELHQLHRVTVGSDLARALAGFHWRFVVLADTVSPGSPGLHFSAQPEAGWYIQVK